MTTKTALVTGAGDALGGAVARRFAKEGLAAVAVRRDASKLNDLVSEISNAGLEAFAFGR